MADTKNTERTTTEVARRPFDRLFDRDWADLFGARWPDFTTRLPELFDEGLHHGIRLEELEEEGTRVIRAELPDLDPESDIEITVRDHQLVIAATRERRTESEEEGTVRTEFRYGSYRRSTPLPVGACEDAISATYRDGILEIRVPLGEEAEAARSVPIGRA